MANKHNGTRTHASQQEALPWSDAGDARTARRVQLMLQGWREGEPRQNHIALQAACDAALARNMGFGQPN